MNSFYDLYDENELYHHGIKGQKWGVRNGPPYPLGSGKDPKRFLSAHANDSFDGAKKMNTDQKLLALRSAVGIVGALSAVLAAYSSYEQKKETRENQKQILEFNKQLKKIQKGEALDGGINSIKKMTDSEIQNEIKRLKLEAEYKRLSNETKSESQKFLEETGKRVAQQAIASAVGLVINKYGGKALDALAKNSSNLINNIKEKRNEKIDAKNSELESAWNNDRRNSDDLRNWKPSSINRRSEDDDSSWNNNDRNHADISRRFPSGKPNDDSDGPFRKDLRQTASLIKESARERSSWNNDERNHSDLSRKTEKDSNGPSRKELRETASMIKDRAAKQNRVKEYDDSISRLEKAIDEADKIIQSPGISENTKEMLRSKQSRNKAQKKIIEIDREALLRVLNK